MRIVGDNAEACIRGVFLHNTAQGHLSYRCHSIGFIQDYELKATDRRGLAYYWCCREYLFGTFGCPSAPTDHPGVRNDPHLRTS